MSLVSVSEADTPRTRRTKAALWDLDAALVEILRVHQPASVREVFYQAVVANLVPKKDEVGYRVVQRRLALLRRDGVIPYTWIADNSRRVVGYQRWYDPEDFIRSISALYTRDYWADNDVRVEVWVEKEALVGVLQPVVVDELGLDLYPARGFSSMSYLERAGATIREIGVATHVYVLSDLDPSGVNIAEKIAEDLVRFAAPTDVVIARIAVTPEQVRTLRLPTRETTEKDPRAARFAREVGDFSVELEAIPPNTLRQIVRDAALRHMDPARLARLRTIEAEERRGFDALAGKMRRSRRGFGVPDP